MGRELASIEDGEKLVFWSNVCSGDTIMYFGILNGKRLLGVPAERKLLRQWQSYDGVWCEFENIPNWNELDEDLDFDIDFGEEKLQFSTAGEDYWFDDVWNPNEKYLTRWRVMSSRGQRRSSYDIATCLCTFKDKHMKSYFFITASEEQSVDVWNQLCDSLKIDIEEDNTKYYTIEYDHEMEVEGIGKLRIDINVGCKIGNIYKKLEIDKIYYISDKNDLVAI